MKSANSSTKIVSFLLAAYPILWIYNSPISIFSWGDLLMLLFLCYCVLNNRKPLLSFPPGYTMFWVVIAILNVIVGISHITPSVLIPGGFGFALFSIILGISIRYIDYALFLKYYKLIFIVAAGILFFQELTWQVMGYRMSFLFPFGTLHDGASIEKLISVQMYDDRSCSLFREPAHFAQYAIPLLVVELFSGKNIDRILTRMSMFIVFTLVVLRSGNGFIAIMILAAIKLGVYIFNSHSRYKYIILVCTIVAASLTISKYIETEAGTDLIERTAEMEYDETAASYIRIYRGYMIFGEYSLYNKLVGMHADDVLSFARHSGASNLFTGDYIADSYYNGVQNSLLYTGILGTFSLCLMLFILSRNNTASSRTLIFIFIVLSFIAQTHLSYLMLYTLYISTQEQKRLFKNESRLLH